MEKYNQALRQLSECFPGSAVLFQMEYENVPKWMKDPLPSIYVTGLKNLIQAFQFGEKTKAFEWAVMQTYRQAWRLNFDFDMFDSVKVDFEEYEWGIGISLLMTRNNLKMFFFGPRLLIKSLDEEKSYQWSQESIETVDFILDIIINNHADN